MKKLLFLLCFLSTSAFAIDRPIPCTGNSCKLLFETTSSGGAKVSAGNVDGLGKWTIGPSTGFSAIEHTIGGNARVLTGHWAGGSSVTPTIGVVLKSLTDSRVHTSSFNTLFGGSVSVGHSVNDVFFKSGNAITHCIFSFSSAIIDGSWYHYSQASNVSSGCSVVLSGGTSGAAGVYTITPLAGTGDSSRVYELSCAPGTAVCSFRVSSGTPSVGSSIITFFTRIGATQ